MSLFNDGRFSGGSQGVVIGHITPDAQDGGLLAIVENGDSITIDILNHKIDLDVPEDEIKKRQANWTPPEPRYTRGVLAKYAKTVSYAALCAVTDLV